MQILYEKWLKEREIFQIQNKSKIDLANHFVPWH